MLSLTEPYLLKTEGELMREMMSEKWTTMYDLDFLW